MRRCAVLVNTLWTVGCAQPAAVDVLPEATDGPSWSDSSSPVRQTDPIEARDDDPLADTALGPALRPTRAPVIALQPAEPTSSDALTLVLPDGLAPADVQITWLLNGQLWRLGTEAQSLQVPESVTERGQHWQVEVVRYDEEVMSKPAHASAVVRNTPPVVSGVRTDPPIPRTEDDLTVTFECSDADADAAIGTIRWSVNGALWLTGGRDSFVSAAQTEPGDTWLAEVWCHDGLERSIDTLATYFTIQ